MTRTAVLYARVSTRGQVEDGFSLRQQMEVLRGWAEEEGYEVLEEVSDAGYSGAYLDRPGIERVRELAEEGKAKAVLAQDRDRFSREPAYLYILREELAAHGCALRAMNDRVADSPEGELADSVLDQLAKYERAKTRERSRRGALRKVSEGRLLASSPRPRFGFRYDGNRTGYEVDGATMPVVRRILSELADGRPIRAVASALDQDGVRTPRGGPAWSRRTIREMALDDVYRPRTVAELSGIVSSDVLAGLEPDGLYGVAWSGRVRTRKVSNRRRVRESPGPEEWIGVPVRLDGSGLSAATVDRARRTMEGNRRSAKIGDRVFELSGGILRCAHCGRAMSAYGRRYGKRPSHYYRCDSPSRTGSDCPNRKSVRAEVLEYAAARTFQRCASDGALLEMFDAAVEEERGRTRSQDVFGRQEKLARTLEGLDEERRNYLRQNARGVLSDAELDSMLAEVGERQEGVAAELRRA